MVKAQRSVSSRISALITALFGGQRARSARRFERERWNYSPTTHLLWVGRWIEVAEHGDSWIFKNGRDAADWLRW